MRLPSLRFRPSRRRLLALCAALAGTAAAGATILTRRRPDGPPVIVAVGRQKRPGIPSDLFFEGVTLAVERVNADGGLLGRPVTLRFVEEPPFNSRATLTRVVAGTLDTASRIADDGRVVAVIGHPSSTTAITAAPIYEQANTLFLATYASSLLLTATRFSRVFAMLPNDREATLLLARYAAERGMRRFVIFNDETSYGQESAGFFAQAVTQGGGAILHHGMLNSGKRSIDALLLFLLDNTLFPIGDLDGIFLSSVNPADNAAFILQARQLGVRIPILGTDTLTSVAVSAQAGSAMLDVIAVSAFDVRGDAPEVRAFDQGFRARFSTAPSPTAALGHDAVMLVAHAAAATHDLDAGVMADAIRIMRYGNPLQGATGRVVFNAAGQATDTDIFILRHDGTVFRTVAGYNHTTTTPSASTPEPETGAVIPTFRQPMEAN
ncbi:branched-chain amino acid transport system substrate-binding protein [Azospirillum agricola]|uniref:ABC transporter substrate-binding protein n=1 Tax=Azospirillum agricola TaxID=1720247 RepID=UPI001AE845AA|nr:ABC transporter substrate-binding protein [Azospirillum agricola]MBP2229018.1 branched-chain amino acid transport system substrate-binding protein [Azospirillum agricola]